MRNDFVIQTIEEICLNTWSSLQQILYDGWILRFANSYTKRANSINPLYKASKNVYEKVARYEQIILIKT